MRKIYFLSTLVLTVLACKTAFTQDFSNKGKDFYLCFPAHVPSTNNATLSIWITSDKASSGTITMANFAFSSTFNIPANGLAEIQVPWSAAHISNAESNMLVKKSIRVKVDAGKPPVVVYAQQWAGARSAATLVLPVNVLGKKYHSVNFTQNTTGRSQFDVIAVKNNTTVKITPRVNGVVGTPITISLPLAGDMYQYQLPSSSGDLTGSLIESIASTSGGCVPIAVFSGSSNLSMGIAGCGSFSSADPLLQQLYPVSSWGKSFGFIPFANYPSGVPYRVMASEDNTSVSFNGSLVAVLNAGQIYPSTFTSQPPVLTAPTFITADKPICVAEYAQSNGCNGSGTIQGDPDMVILNPLEQSIQDITIFSTRQQVINSQWLNVLLKTTATASFRISRNGGLLTPPASAWQPFPFLPGYSYLREQLPTPIGISDSYRLVADSGFNAIAYGWGDNESYAYSAGTFIKDLYTQLGFGTSYGGTTSPKACIGSGSKIKISLPYQADSIWWNINQLPGSPSDTMTRYPPSTFDSTTISNGKTLYWYSLPTYYYFNTVGTFPVTITTYSPNSDGCGSTQDYDFEVEVFSKPVADFNFTTDGCVTNPVLFTDNSNTAGRPVVSRYWNFGDATTSTINNPSHTYAAPGSYNVKYTLITDIGCLADTALHVVTLNNPPAANFNTTGPYCDGNSISFTDISTAGVTIWNWNFGDPASGANNTSTSQNPSHTFSGPGTYTVTLTVSTGSCQSLPYQFPVTVFPKPVSDFSFPNAICLPSGATQFTDLSTVGAGNTITDWNWNFGDGSPNSTAQNPLHNYAGVGPYTVTLTVTTNNGCTNTRVRTVNTINAEPQAAFNWPAEVCTGSPAAFTDNSTAPGSTVTGWNWNFGDPASGANNTSTLQNPTHIFSGPGTYTVTLNVTSAAGCQTVNNSSSHTVVVKALPTASISGNATVCLNATSPNITFTGANGTAPYTFSYSINGGPSQNVTTSSGNSVTVSVPTNTAGTFTYALLNVQEGSSATCSQSQTGSVTVTVSQLPTATVSGNSTVCLNGPSPNITFTGAGTSAPYTFTYNINGGAPQTVNTTSGNSVTVSVPTNVAGTFTYNLVSVQDGSANLCSQSQTGSAVITVNPLPTASLSGTTEVCLNAASPTITFTGANGTAPYTFVYTINGGPNQTITTSSGNSVTLSVPTGTAGTFVYSLVNVTEGSATACSQAQSGSATVTVNPLPSADFNAIAPLCVTRIVSFSDISVPNAGSIANWQWNFDDPGSGANNTSTSQNPSHVFATTGTYNVTLTVTTNKGCVSTVTTKPVTVNVNPKAGYISPQVCVSDANVQFTDTSSVAPGSIMAWNWNFGDPGSGGNNTSTLQNPTHTFSSTGNFTATLIVTSNNGCKDTIAQTFTVNGSVPVSDFNVQNSGTLCSNQQVSITDASSVDFGSIIRTEVYWDYTNDPTIKTTDNSPVPGRVYTHTYPEFGSPATRTVSVRYVVYSGINCVSTLTKNVTLLATPTLQFNTINPVCSNVPSFQITQAQLLNSLPGVGVFSGPGVSPVGLFNPTTAGNGTHTIQYTYTGTNGCVNSVSQTIDVNPTPIANAGPDKFVLEGGVVTLTPAVNASYPITYTWTPPLGLSNPNISNPLASPPDDQTYTLTVTSDKGCSTSDQVFVKVLKSLVIPNVFSPNGDNINDKWDIRYLESYPGCTVDVYNRYGQVIFHSVGYSTPWDGTYKGKPVPTGSYYYIIDPKNGRSKYAGFVDVLR